MDSHNILSLLGLALRGGNLVVGEEPVDAASRARDARAVGDGDVEYGVAAVVVVPSSLSYRYYGTDELVMTDQTFLRETGSSSVMYYACNTKEELPVSRRKVWSFITNSSVP